MKLTQRGTAAALILAAAAACSGTAQAATAVAGGLRVGTLGLGAEGTIGLTDRLNLRVPFNVFSYDYDQTEDGIEYEGTLDLKSFGVQLDLHPFKGSFYLSAGLYSNGNQVDLKASDPSGTEEYEVGGGTYVFDTSDPLRLNGGLDFNSAVPYLGLGWGNAIQGASNVYFRFELGAYFQGAAKVKLDASGSAVNVDTGNSFDVDDGSIESQVFQANLEAERADVEDDASDYKIYPAISFALGYRFNL